jgi:hypothetical protein
MSKVKSKTEPKAQCHGSVEGEEHFLVSVSNKSMNVKLTYMEQIVRRSGAIASDPFAVTP